MNSSIESVLEILALIRIFLTRWLVNDLSSKNLLMTIETTEMYTCCIYLVWIIQEFSNPPFWCMLID